MVTNTNLSISDRLPEEYFPEIEQKHPGVLESQWIPTDPDLWKIANYLEFLDARRELLAEDPRIEKHAQYGEPRLKITGSPGDPLLPDGCASHRK